MVERYPLTWPSKPGQDYRVPAGSIVISTNIGSGKKGRPFSGMAEPDDTGAAVYFKLDGLDYCLPCDKWDRVADNLAAIAAHINAMRGIERWGVGTSKDVYTGFKALPQAAGSRNGAWWTVLGVDPNPDPNEVETARNKLLKKFHPDNLSTGDKEKFIRVQIAYQEALTFLEQK